MDREEARGSNPLDVLTHILCYECHEPIGISSDPIEVYCSKCYVLMCREEIDDGYWNALSNKLDVLEGHNPVD